MTEGTLRRKEIIFVCSNCGKRHVRYVYEAYGQIDFSYSDARTPYRMEGTEGDFCHETCATLFIVKSVRRGE